MFRRKGQAIVEMALVFPIFILVIVGGLIDFGFAFYNSITLQQLANDTAQWAAENNVTSDDDIANFVADKKPGWWSGAFVVNSLEQVTLQSGGIALRVSMTYASPTYTPFYQTMLQGITGNPSINLSALAAYKIPQHVYTRL